MALLIVIYLAFISLGLPDGVLGSIWPLMHADLGLAISDAGVLSAITSIGTVLSALVGHRMVARFKTGPVTAVSVAATAFGLWGFSVSTSLWALALFSIPLGLGAGSVDSALNNYVALHYKAHHMNWLHSFWGVGAAGGPALMALTLFLGHSYRSGWRLISAIQAVLVLILFLSLPLFARHKAPVHARRTKDGQRRGVRKSGLALILSSFFLYCLIEASTGLWAVSYLVQVKGVEASTAALYGSLFYLGITVGRMVSGFVSLRLSNSKLIASGLVIMAVGLVSLLLSNATSAIFALLAIGLGCAPIFPSLIHETPRRFSIEESGRVIGLQMATAYVGSTTAGPLFGLMAHLVGLAWMVGLQGLFFVLLALTVTLFLRRTTAQSV
ncbi:MAG: MFS transporter [Sphaerochaeta sp.]|jgi:fucose permease|nr:MFS transporter [Sphaerochaeta sp.]MDX9915240.1 MFS transporter [Sphaerochaeta sp.]